MLLIFDINSFVDCEMSEKEESESFDNIPVPPAPGGEAWLKAQKALEQVQKGNKSQSQTSDESVSYPQMYSNPGMYGSLPMNPWLNP